MDIKTFEKLFKLKNELDLHKSTIEKLKALQEQASLLRRRLAADEEKIYCMDDFPWRPLRVTPLQYIQLVADSDNNAEFKLNEDEWNAIVCTAIKLKEDRVQRNHEGGGSNMMKLTSENVDKVIYDCLYGKSEDHHKALSEGKLIEGVRLKVVFNPEKVEKHRQDIKDMLAQLPLAFRKEDGGGWSFLQMCNDAEGNQWTGVHKQMDALVCLGLAIDELRFCLPREMWKVFPDGMPYVQIF